MTNLSSTAEEIEPLVGFSYGNVQCPKNLVPDDVSGIYLWPQPFRVSNYIRKIIVWVLHIHLNESDRDDETVVELFNKLLNLLCSKVVEIKSNNDGIPFLETRHKLTTDGVPKQMLCKSFVQLVRTSYKPSKVIISEDSEAVEHLRKLIPAASVSSLDGLACVRIAHINDNDKPLHDDSGFLSLHTKMHDRLDDAINLIGDSKYIFPKLDKDGLPLRIYQVKNFIENCIYYANHEFSQGQPHSSKLEAAAMKNSDKEELSEALDEKIDRLLVVASEEIQAGMITALNEWINHNLTLATIYDCGKIHEKQCQQVMNDIKYGVIEQDASIKFNKLLREKTEQSRKHFENMQEFVINFHTRIQEKAATHGCISKSKFNEMLEEEIHRTTTEARLKMGELSTEYVRRACNKLAHIYKYYNKKILVEEEFLILSMCESLKLWYNEEMSRMLKESYYSPTQLLKIHSHLDKTLTNNLTTAFRFQSAECCQFITENVKLLTEELAKEFEQHKKANRLKLEKLQKEMNVLIQSSVDHYSEAIIKIHEAAQKEARIMLENDIRKQVGGEEPVKVHLQALQNRIDKVCSSLIRKNNGTGSDTKKVETTSLSNSVQSSCSRPTTPTNGMNNNNGLPQQKVRLSQLIIHLSLNYIRVGIEHGNRFLQLPPVPAIVGITSKNRWVWGEDERLKDTSTKVWLIRECNRPWNEQVRIGDNISDITVEFLLGFLLGALKEHLEKMLNGEISQAVLIIPFWFTSSQRQQMKDAGNIAGFTETRLINENSAIAFSSTNECSESSDIVVLCENSGHVDVTVYAYDKQKENLKMRGHHAVYEKKEKQRAQRPSELSLEYWKFLTFGDKVSESTGNAVQEAYTHAKRQAETWKTSKADKSRPKYVFVSFESENYWKDVLVRTAQGITEKADLVCSPCNDILLGVGLACRNPSRFYEVVQDCISSTIYKRNPISSSFEKIVQDNYNALPLNDTKLIIYSDLPMYTSKARFYQKGISGDAVIGDLILKDSLEDICVKLCISNEGIVSLHGVNAKTRYNFRCGSEKIALENNHYSWTRPNLNPGQIGSFASLLQYLKEAKTASRVKASRETEQSTKNTIN